MRLQLKNIGKIDSADIEIQGITLIAGENNTGKSTVSKILYCMFHALLHIETFQNNRRSLKNISKDMIHNEFMTDCEKEVIDFDRVKETYCKNLGLIYSKSNDALYIKSENELFFIEFKNGKIDK